MCDSNDQNLKSIQLVLKSTLKGEIMSESKEKKNESEIIHSTVELL
jgi:hypothetical protein